MTQPTLNTLARRRKSVRKFKPEAVPMETILSILDTAHYAPSGANEQPWRFFVITDPELKKKVRQSSEKGEREMYAKVSGEFKDWLTEHGLNPEKPFLEEAPVLILVLMRVNAKYARESIWTSIGYILLALEEQGYHTVPYTPSNTYYPLNELDIPKWYRLEAILPIGLSEDNSPRTDRISLNTIVFINKCGHDNNRRNK